MTKQIISDQEGIGACNRAMLDTNHKQRVLFGQYEKNRVRRNIRYGEMLKHSSRTTMKVPAASAASAMGAV